MPRRGSKERIIIGIDPGASGGIIALDGTGEWRLSSKMPRSMESYHSMFLGEEARMKNLYRDSLEVRVFIERVGGYQRESPDGQLGGEKTGHSMFNFGLNVAEVYVFAWLTFGKPKLVMPTSWQTAAGLKRPKGMSKTEWKRMIKERAMELYPDVEVTNYLADALLVAHYGRVMWDRT